MGRGFLGGREHEGREGKRTDVGDGRVLANLALDVGLGPVDPDLLEVYERVSEWVGGIRRSDVRIEDLPMR